ncbi:hypothetical protein NC653_040338 [Populus alba x Populus x berolinensis]|uniref:Uncharacterized protein n=2 Tax=Populus TaxID=3689 RepID=A0AAD6LG28_9ROSI|nr:hypothetical protein NC653_040338 [Populus alba x Populus x berolinensis]
MGSSSAQDIPAMQEIVLEFRAGKMVFFGKKVVPDSQKGLVRIGRVNQALGRVYILKFNTDDRKSLFGCRSQKLKMILNCVALSTIILIIHLAEFLDEEEPDASTPFQVFEDMLEDSISSRNGNLIVPDHGAEGGPRDVMIHVAGSSGDPDEGSLNSRGYFRLVAESSFPSASGFFYLCKKCEV